jgi:hypothetical protein
MRDLIKFKELDSLMAALARPIREHVERELEPLRKRIAELEARPAMPYKGVHQRAQKYSRGSVVTFRDSLWIALNDTSESEIPDSSTNWQLMLKLPERSR